jgi:hypothetical protein
MTRQPPRAVVVKGGEHMHCKLVRTLALALVVLCLGLSLATAATQTIKGIIQTINLDDASFTLMTADKKTLAFKVPVELLEGVKIGDEVLVTVDDGEVIAISPDEES